MEHKCGKSDFFVITMNTLFTKKKPMTLKIKETIKNNIIAGTVLSPFLLIPMIPIWVCLVLSWDTIRNYHLVHGLPATAVIQSVQETSQRVGMQVVYRINVEVTPPDAVPFDSYAEQIISVMNAPAFQPGHILNVKYDPKDHDRVLVTSYSIVKQY